MCNFTENENTKKTPEGNSGPFIAVPSDEALKSRLAVLAEGAARRELKKPDGSTWFNDEIQGVSYLSAKEKAKGKEAVGITNSPCTLDAVLESPRGCKARWRFRHMWSGKEVTAVTPANDDEWLGAVRALSNAGLYIGDTYSSNHSIFADYLRTAWGLLSKDVPHITLVDRIGWINEDCTAFATFGQIFAADEAVSEHFALDLPSSNSVKVRQRGNLELWKEKIAHPCWVYSRLLSCEIMTALYGPLNRVLGATNTNPIFFLVGHSGTGKTTALEVASSVWGIQRVSLSGSAKGAEGLGALCNDLYFAADETQTAKRKLQPIIYLLGNGDAGVYMTRDRKVVASASFSASVGFAGEQSLLTTVQQLGGTVLDGATVRCLGIPIDETRKAKDGETLMGVFDSCPAGDRNAENIAGQINEALKNDCFGVVGEAFISALVADIGKRPDGVQGVRDEFKSFTEGFKQMVSACGPLDGVSGRALRSFAGYAFAGVLAVRYGVLPWTEDYPSQAVAYAFSRWMGREDSKEKQLQDVAETLASIETTKTRSYDLSNGLPSMDPRTYPDSLNSVATALKYAGATVAVIYPDKRFKEICAKSGFNFTEVADYLLRHNALVSNRAGAVSNPSMRGTYQNGKKDKLDMRANVRYWIVATGGILNAREGEVLEESANDPFGGKWGPDKIETIKSLIAKCPVIQQGEANAA